MGSKRLKVTILDVARVAGVSKSTVSRVLAGAPNISEEARTRVGEAVAATGYRRNSIASSLRSGQTGMVGLLIPDIANPFWADVARGAQDAAAERGTSILIFSSDWDADRERQHLHALVQARVDGAIVNPVRDGLHDIADFGLPTVLIGSSAARFPNLTSVTSDIEQGVAMALERIAASGLGLPAFLVGNKHRSASARFLAAVDVWFKLQGKAPPDPVIVDGHYSVEGGRSAVTQLLKSGPPPRVIFAANDLMALGAMQAVRAHGLHCPDDVAILGFDGIAAGEVTSPPLTTIAKPARMIGEHAFRALIKGLGSSFAEHLTLPCTLREGGSLPAMSHLHAKLAG